MNLGLLYLMVRSVRGRILRTIRLLKRPKYLVSVLAFGAWMTVWVGGPLLFERDGREINVEFANAEMFFEFMGDALPALRLVVALALALLVSLWWLAPWSRLALNLSEAEIHMLTPMPLKRRHLIQYATLKSQPGILFGSTIMTLFLGAGGPLTRGLWFLAFWMVLTLWDLHSKGRALWLERQKELPRARAWRNRLVLSAAIIAYWIALGAAVSGLLPELLSLRPAPGQELFDFLRQTLAAYEPQIQSGLFGRLLLPFRWVTTPLFLFAPGADTMLKVTGVAVPVILLLAHNEWVVRSQTKFEEAALAHARREASKRSPGRRYWKTSVRSRRRVPFALSSLGAPEVGILWKNAMIVTRFSYRSLLLFGVAVIALALLVPIVFTSFPGAPFVILAIGLMTMVMSPLTGSQSYRNDLRTDLLRLETMRQWPIEGWKLFAAEVAAPAVFAGLTALLGAGLVLAMDVFMTINGSALARLDSGGNRLLPASAAATLGVPQPLLVPLILLGLIPVVLALTCLSAAVQNLLVLAFPGWVQLGHDKQKGAAAAGQNIIMVLGLGLASSLCLLPAALIIAIIVALQTLVFDLPVVGWELPVFGIIAATPVFAVVALIVRVGGRVWDKLDPSHELLQGSV